jgi:hypothetical protein
VVKLHPERERNPRGKRPKVKNRELDAMVAAAWQAGWHCVKLSKGHVMCYPPDKTMKPVLVASTPSDHRTIPNTRAAMRQRGLNV